MITWACYKTTITNPNQDTFYKWIYANKDDELFKKAPGKRLVLAISLIDGVDSELET